MTTTAFTHYHVWADGHRVVLCKAHATKTRLAMLDNSAGRNRNNPPLAPEACEFGHCYTDRCWVGRISDRAVRMAPTTMAYRTGACTPCPA